LGENKKELARVALKKQAVPTVEAFRSSPERLAELGREHGVPPVDLARLSIPVSLLDWVPRETALSHVMLPVRADGAALTVVMADPRNQRAIEELAFVTGLRVEVLVAPKLDVLAFAERAYAAQRRGELMASGPAAEEGVVGGSGATDSEVPFDEFAGFQSLSLRGEALAEVVPSVGPAVSASSRAPSRAASTSAPAADRK
jgi:type II secretory ATPase GspE/PulE/Tfp pilus assembly ATPase PilB-like protein